MKLGRLKIIARLSAKEGKDYIRKVKRTKIKEGRDG